jgi:hypothetical protein
MRRPHRLWVVVLINVALGVLTLALIGLWLVKVNAVHKVTAGIFVHNYALHILLCAVLIASSIFALLGSGRARWIALGTAILFFGFHLIQSVWLYYLSGLALRRDQGLFLESSVERNALALILNLWAFLSDKTDEFFDAKGPNNRWRGP